MFFHLCVCEGMHDFITSIYGILRTCLCECKVYCEGVTDLLGHRCRRVSRSVFGFRGAVREKGQCHDIRKQKQSPTEQVSGLFTSNSTSSIYSSNHSLCVDHQYVCPAHLSVCVGTMNQQRGGCVGNINWEGIYG